MANYLILKQTGPNVDDLEIAGVAENRKNNEVDQAIKEKVTDIDATYIAVPFDPDTIFKRKATTKIEIAELTPEDEAKEAEAAPAQPVKVDPPPEALPAVER